MTLSKEKAKEMLEAAKPLIKWIAENCHPHCTATVDCASVDLSECVANEATDEFLGEPYEAVCPNCGEKTALSVGPSVAACRVCMHSWKLPKDHHASDCATHNGPAMEEGPCDCGAKPPQCCAMLDAEHRCEKPATFEIFDCNEPHPELASTHSCDEHVGALIGSVPPTPAAGSWTIHMLNGSKIKAGAADDN